MASERERRTRRGVELRMIHPHAPTPEETDSLVQQADEHRKIGRPSGTQTKFSKLYHLNRGDGRPPARLDYDPLPDMSDTPGLCAGVIRGGRPCKAVEILANGLCLGCWDVKCGTIASGSGGQARKTALEETAGVRPELLRRKKAA